MGDEQNNTPSKAPYVIVAAVCAGASFFTVVSALGILHSISDVGMCAIAMMAFAPTLLGIGIAFFISRQPPRG